MLLLVKCDSDAVNIETKSHSVEFHSEKNIVGISLMDQGKDQQKSKELVVPINTHEGNFSLLESGKIGFSSGGGLYDMPLSCFGCGIGWFSFILGFIFPPLWYYAAILYLWNYYLKDPRERPGLAASAIAALICSVAILISLLAVFC